MAIQIQILSQQAVTKPTKTGKTYQQLEVAYKNLTFQGKVEGKNLMSFGATAEAFKTLATAQAGDIFDIEIVKNDKGYNDWVAAKKSNGAAPPQPARTAQSTGSTPVPVATKSTYETPEERAKKQIYIIRQSSISSAIDLLSVGAKSPAKVDDVLKTAKDFENFVFGDATATAAEDPAVLSLDNFPTDDIPF